MVDEGRVRIFISYSHEDVELRAELETHLAILKRLDAVETWHDGMITPGQEWEKAIWDEFEAADLILLLVSANFVSSEFCWGKELIKAMARHEAGTAHVIPVTIEACVWKGAPFEKLSGLPTDMKAVTSWDNRNEAWTNVVEGIAAAVNRLDLKNLATPSSPVSMSIRAGEVRPVGGLRKFSLEVEAAKIPQNGYILWQTLLHVGSLIYEAPDVQDEILWPDFNPSVALAVRDVIDPGPSLIHGALSGLFPPFPVSHHVGPLLRLRLQCPDPSSDIAHRHPVYLLPFGEEAGTSGALYKEPDGTVPLEVVEHMEVPGYGRIGVAGSVELVCDPHPTPLASDTPTAS